MKCFLTLTTIVLLSFSSCKKEETDPILIGGPCYVIHNDTLPKLTKDYALFKIGTYWIYQDSASGMLDSNYVTESIDIINHSIFSGNVFNQEHSYCTFCSTLDSGLHNNSYQGECGGFSGFYYNRGPNDMDRQESVSIGIPTSDSISQVLPTNSIINNQSYSEAIVYRETGIIHTPCGNITYYFAKNFGLVRKEYSSPFTVWKLIRYNIVQ